MYVPMTADQMHAALNENGYICEMKLAGQIVAALNTQPMGGFFAFGKAGSGKTYLPEVLSKILTDAKILDHSGLFYQMTANSTFEDLVFKPLPSENTISGVRLVEGVVTQVLNLSRKGRVILTLDEWDKSRASADAALLEYLQFGRVIYDGLVNQGKPENIVTVITMNDERQLSEPLMRRLPWMTFEPPSVETVFRALMRTHPEHGFVRAATILYARSLRANGLEKPVTIQELRQLLDAITTLGQGADWDSLVFQFVTKSPLDHARIAATENITVENLLEAVPVSTRAKLSAGKYDWGDRKLEEQKTMSLFIMPRPVVQIVPVVETIDVNTASGIVSPVDYAYDAALGENPPAPDKNPAKIGDYAAVAKGGVIQITRPIQLKEYNKVSKLWDKEGEISFYEPDMTMADLMDLRAQTDAKVIEYSQDRVVLKKPSEKAGSIDILWERGKGAEIIAPLKDPDLFSRVFGLNGNSTDRGYIPWMSFPYTHIVHPDTPTLHMANHVTHYPWALGGMWRRIMYDPTSRGHRARKAKSQTIVLGNSTNYETKKAGLVTMKYTFGDPVVSRYDSRYVLVEARVTITNAEALPENTGGLENNLQSNTSSGSFYDEYEFTGQTAEEAIVQANEILHLEAVKIALALRKQREKNKTLGLPAIPQPTPKPLKSVRKSKKTKPVEYVDPDVEDKVDEILDDVYGEDDDEE